MSEGNINNHNLEHALYKILELQSKPDTGNPVDTMLMLSLLNLLGIVSLLNKQSSQAASNQLAGINPLVGMLGSMLGGVQQKTGEENTGSAQGGLPFNPAALLNMVTPQSGNQMDPALLLKLLRGLLKSAPQTEDQKSKPGGAKAVVESQQAGKTTEVKRRNTIPSWDSRFGAG
ncbi:MAG TPA: hypothetical protein DCK76_03080 [Desulfotomaculum sp.]|nr:hypothetical protein [Desulfotomaculum sp.]